uniref:Pectinesterase/pectinesterase inhibitor 28 n=1 Tax=Cajanus cajan TaxID=3821 RepID=A0A151SF98_CAJCA|nr:Putative pectinesterase/pectinesterase inhibitor 28 [Cajanus cajan]
MSDEIAEKAKRITIIVVSILLLVAMIIAMTAGFNVDEDNSNDDTQDNKKNITIVPTGKFVQTLYHPTNYKKECEGCFIAKVENTTDLEELVKIVFNITITKISDKLKEISLLHEVEEEPRAKIALDTCKQLMDLSIGELTRSLDEINEFDLINLKKILMNLKVWLSDAITYQDTCLHGFQNTTSEVDKKMKDLLITSIHKSNNVLAIITQLVDTIKDPNVTKLFGRRLLQEYES